MKKIALLVFSVLLLSSCNELLQVASQVGTLSTSTSAGVTNSENIAGLKSALNVGIQDAVGFLGKENGFYSDAALKILLPKEAQPIIDNIKLIPGGQKLVNDAILSLNRSAEDAVKEATPIFKSAITSMSITDAASILFGADNAATTYLHGKTYNSLKTDFRQPKAGSHLQQHTIR